MWFKSLLLVLLLGSCSAIPADSDALISSSAFREGRAEQVAAEEPLPEEEEALLEEEEEELLPEEERAAEDEEGALEGEEETVGEEEEEPLPADYEEEFEETCVYNDTTGAEVSVTFVDDGEFRDVLEIVGNEIGDPDTILDECIGVRREQKGISAKSARRRRPGRRRAGGKRRRKGGKRKGGRRRRKPGKKNAKRRRKVNRRKANRRRAQNRRKAANNRGSNAAIDRIRTLASGNPVSDEALMQIIDLSQNILVDRAGLKEKEPAPVLMVSS